MPGLLKLVLHGDFSKAGGIRLPEQLKCLQLFKFEGHITDWPSGLETLELFGAGTGNICLPPSLTSLVMFHDFEGTISSQSGAPLQHLTELMLCGRPAGHDAVLIPLSPRLRRLCLDVDFADDRTLELPPVLEELVIGAGVTRLFALPLPPGLCRANMHSQHQDGIQNTAMWRKRFVEGLPASVKELRMYRELTIALPLDGDEQEQLHEPHDIAWPASICSLVLRYWEVGMDLPPCITSLSLTETLPFTLDNLVFSTALALESLYISGLSGGTHDVYERLGDL
eukprot:TRINITY_DN1897_c0_g1_i1.p1 TRINITY_DN1897_c0_g1~~TRINITY_DN1897_c0_g1_i1.p1  ORF type:complete len:283 (-),score=45.01 TRINITY_DN1897_c0_g1_i1:511-1359(-)